MDNFEIIFKNWEKYKTAYVSAERMIATDGFVNFITFADDNTASHVISYAQDEVFRITQTKGA